VRSSLGRSSKKIHAREGAKGTSTRARRTGKKQKKGRTEKRSAKKQKRKEGLLVVAAALRLEQGESARKTWEKGEGFGKRRERGICAPYARSFYVGEWEVWKGERCKKKKNGRGREGVRLGKCRPERKKKGREKEIVVEEKATRSLL